MKKALSYVLIAMMSTGLLAGCGAKTTTQTQSGGAPQTQEKEAAETPQKEVTIKIVQNKVEINDALKKMILEFEKENPGIRVKLDTIGGGADYGGGLMAKFQSGDAPDIFVCSGYADLDKWFEKVEDLSDQSWVSDMVDGSQAAISKDGKIYGFPLALEGFGFAYNKALFEKAGITTIPTTLGELEEVCKKLEAAGIQPFSNSYAEWWALGLHNFTVPLAHQKDTAAFIADVARGNAKMIENEVTDGWFRLLDLTVKYGQKNPTVTGDYASSVAAFAAGDAAMIQQGNWIQPDLDKVDETIQVGFLPMPISDTAEDMIYAGVPNYWSVNKESAAKEEAKVFLNWLASSETGRHYLTEEIKAVPAFKSVKAENAKGLNAALAEYASAGKAYSFEFPRLPAGGGELIGPEIMKYLGGQCTKEELCAAIDKIIIDKAAAQAQ